MSALGQKPDITGTHSNICKVRIADLTFFRGMAFVMLETNRFRRPAQSYGREVRHG
jgi:hypothetical protein